MKKKLQNIIDRICVIYKVCVTKHFVFTGYNSFKDGESKGACFIETIPENDEEKRIFVETICGFLIGEFIDVN